jgi:GNAT superfamily N-acetyltransferase
LQDAFEIVRSDPDAAAARWCVSEYYRELQQLFEGGFDPAAAAYAGPGASAAAVTYLALVRHGVEPVGCGSLIWNADDRRVGEIKRMWIAPPARGLGLARRLVEHLESVARENGLIALRLDTNKSLVEARSLYLRAGYQSIPRYNDNPYAHHWFGKDL